MSSKRSLRESMHTLVQNAAMQPEMTQIRGNPAPFPANPHQLPVIPAGAGRQEGRAELTLALRTKSTAGHRE